MLTKTDILSALGNTSDTGKTAKQVAAFLHSTSVRISQKLGQLHAYGELDRRLLDPARRTTTEYLYWIKAPKAAPTMVAWDGPVLLAASRMRDREAV